MKAFNIFIRILVTPLIFAISFIAFTGQAFLRAYWFLRYGGEWIGYSKIESRETISGALAKIIKLLEKQEQQ